jgi:hypothetical protein
MPDNPSALDHLLEGREALNQEIERLSSAIEELDAVIERLGGRRPGSTPPRAGVQQLRTRATSTAVAPARLSGRGAGAGQPRSIRMHVLDMLAAEDRDFGLAEIIERVHDAGIQAHDDAVRSITIKLMKDGRVERVGRGQYRLARRGSARPIAEEPTLDAEADAIVDEALAELIVEEAAVEQIADESPADATAATDLAESAESSDPGQPADAAPEESGAYTPPLNLGQPWEADY